MLGTQSPLRAVNLRLLLGPPLPALVEGGTMTLRGRQCERSSPATRVLRRPEFPTEK